LTPNELANLHKLANTIFYDRLYDYRKSLNLHNDATKFLCQVERGLSRFLLS